MDSAIAGERILFQLPIRIGRNPLNQCQVVHGFISDFHATVEVVDGQLCVRDLNSKNGTYSPSGERYAAYAPVPLNGPTHEFIVGRLLYVTVEVVEQDRIAGERMSATSGSVLGNRAALEAGPNAWRRPEVASLPPLSGAAPAALQPRYASSPPAPAAPQWHASPPDSLQLPSLAPAAGHRPGGRSASSNPPPPNASGVSRSTQHFSMSVETMALLGLRELAASLLPGVPLETTGDVARLLTKLHDVVEMFCRCFVPMREGYAQFVSQLDLRRAATQRSMNRSGTAMKVEGARDPASVAAALLDWRNQDYDGPDVIEGIFTDLMVHQLALLEGVMRGVKALLDELSPAAVERVLRDQPPPGVSAMLGRYRALWKTFESHHEELANETRTFELVFGSEFAASYREYLARGGNGTIP